MTIASFLVFVANKDIFYAGETVTGFVQIVVTGVMQVPGVTLKFEGVAKAQWNDHRSRGHGKERHSYTVTCTSKIPLGSSEQNLPIENGTLAPGEHKLPFSIKLPIDLVTSFESSICYVRYWIEAKLQTAFMLGAVSPRAHTQVKVIQLIDPNLEEYAFGVMGGDMKVICCMCCAQGPIELKVQTDRAAYCPNEPILLTATIYNGSKREITPIVKFIRKVTVLAEDPERHNNTIYIGGGGYGGYGGYNSTCSRELLNSVPLEIEGKKNVMPGETQQWNAKRFIVPLAQPSMQIQNILITYHIEIMIHIPYSFDIEVYLPIIISTLPYRGPQAPTAAAPITRQITAGPSAAAPIQQWRGTTAQVGGRPTIPPPIAPANQSQAQANNNAVAPPYFEVILAQPPMFAPDDHLFEFGHTRPPTMNTMGLFSL